jgi:hypothetical protein
LKHFQRGTDYRAYHKHAPSGRSPAKSLVYIKAQLIITQAACTVRIQRRNRKQASKQYKQLRTKANPKGKKIKNKVIVFLTKALK